MTKIIAPTALKSNKKSNYFIIGIKKARSFLFGLFYTTRIIYNLKRTFLHD